MERWGSCRASFLGIRPEGEGAAGGERAHSLSQVSGRSRVVSPCHEGQHSGAGVRVGVVSLSMRGTKPGPGWAWAQTPALLGPSSQAWWASKQRFLTILIPATGLKAGAGPIPQRTARLRHTGSTSIPRPRYVHTPPGLAWPGLAQSKPRAERPGLVHGFNCIGCPHCGSQRLKQKASLGSVHAPSGAPKVTGTCCGLCQYAKQSWILGQWCLWWAGTGPGLGSGLPLTQLGFTLSPSVARSGGSHQTWGRGGGQP